jgi:hypothetical protein
MGHVFKIIALVCNVGFFQDLDLTPYQQRGEAEDDKKQRLTTYPGLKI